jgi:hypothetical protein
MLKLQQKHSSLPTHPVCIYSYCRAAFTAC